MNAHQRYIDAARDAVEAWDGQETADLFLDILQRTGEDALGVLEGAKYRSFAAYAPSELDRPARSDG